MLAHGVPRRRLHYFSGFDPRGPAYYHRLCREEAAKPQPDGAVLAVGPRQKLSPHVHRWTVQWQAADGGEPVQTEHVFMGWDDIVRTHWSRNPLRVAREFCQGYLHLFRHVGLARLSRMYPPVFHATALPLLLAALPALLALALWAAAGWQAALGALVLGGLAWVFAARAGLGWLVRIGIFFYRMGSGPIAGLDARTRDWLELVIARQSQDPVDEVLLVGHSVGTLVMVDAVDALLRDPRWQALQTGRPTLMLTLGHSIPMVAMAPAAEGFRRAVERLSRHPALCWWDVTARIDPLCFYNLHPLAGSGLPHGDAPWPRAHLARFMSMYEPATWARIRRNKLQAHFLYLLTPQKQGNFSPYEVLYGPRSLQNHEASSRRQMPD